MIYAPAIIFHVWLPAPQATINLMSSPHPPTPDQTGKGARVVAETSQLTGDLVEDKIQSLITQHREPRPEQALKRLDQVAQRLDRVSSAESIDEMAGQLQNWLGLESRAVEPIPEADDGDFDSAGIP